MIIAIVISGFLACGAITTATISRVMNVRLTLWRVLSAFLVSFVVSACIASLAVFVSAQRATDACPEKQSCEYGGLMEGGLMILLLWLAIYSVIYVAASFLVARYQGRRYMNAAQKT
jgi:hypothetical protein